MNIFDIYLEKITKIIKSESKNNSLKLPDKLDSINVEIDLNMGEAKHTVYTCDFTHDYIKINADYGKN